MNDHQGRPLHRGVTLRNDGRPGNVEPETHVAKADPHRASCDRHTNLRTILPVPPFIVAFRQVPDLGFPVFRPSIAPACLDTTLVLAPREPFPKIERCRGAYALVTPLNGTLMDMMILMINRSRAWLPGRLRSWGDAAMVRRGDSRKGAIVNHQRSPGIGRKFQPAVQPFAL